MLCRSHFKGPRKKNLSKCRVILREPRRLKNPLGVREILRSLGLPQDDMNRLEFCKLFFREPLAACGGSVPAAPRAAFQISVSQLPSDDQ